VTLWAQEQEATILPLLATLAIASIMILSPLAYGQSVPSRAHLSFFDLPLSFFVWLLLLNHGLNRPTRYDLLMTKSDDSYKQASTDRGEGVEEMMTKTGGSLTQTHTHNNNFLTACPRRTLLHTISSVQHSP
jgi:hypothetical protein